MTHPRPGMVDPEIAAAVQTLWDYHDLHHQLTPSDVGIGLGSHDLSVATVAAELYQSGLFPLILFTGANAPTTVDRFPRGEAVHYREQALTLGVPNSAILTEGNATNTGENITRSRDLLAAQGHRVEAVTLICRPYQQRRAYATCRKLWPEVRVQCASASLPVSEYIAQIGDESRVITMLVGDTQRIEVYAERQLAITQPMPDSVREAMRQLVSTGYVDRLIR